MKFMKIFGGGLALLMTALSIFAFLTPVTYRIRGASPEVGLVCGFMLGGLLLFVTAMKIWIWASNKNV